ncbi:hypothetical protein HDU96_003518 [Phlyctochytrium bullatum]|nr:hypothetical protein HDU96_003518 [Phlyctochytrium bullatum]
MEGLGASTSNTSSANIGEATPVSKLQSTVLQYQRRLQTILDSTTPYYVQRWCGTAAIFALYFIRVWLLSAYYIVTYALGIYLLNLFLAFLQPKFDPALEDGEEEDEDNKGPALPMKNDDEFRPFIRRLPEFKFWYWATRGITTAFLCTFFPFLDVPVFWPILLMYFIILFALTMKQRIKHMIKYKYVPWNIGKKQYGSKPVVGGLGAPSKSKE